MFPKIHKWYVSQTGSSEVLAVFFEQPGKEYFASLVNLSIEEIDKSLRKRGVVNLPNGLTIRKTTPKKSGVSKASELELGIQILDEFSE